MEIFVSFFLQIFISSQSIISTSAEIGSIIYFHSFYIINYDAEHNFGNTDLYLENSIINLTSSKFYVPMAGFNKQNRDGIAEQSDLQ